MNKQIFNLEKLVDRANKASEDYYNGTESMTNKEFDDLVDEIKHIEEETGYILPNSPTQVVGAEAVDSLPKFKHPYPALSLDKTKDVNEMKKKFLQGIRDSGGVFASVVVMFKEDGSTLQAYYRDGKLDKLVTRGDGEVGNIVTHNARCLRGLPLTIPIKSDVVVRGEALMSYSEFERINSTLPDDVRYKNPRNLASATMTMLDSNEACKRCLQFKAFNLVKIDENDEYIAKYAHELIPDQLFSGRLLLLNQLGFSTVEFVKKNVTLLEDAIDEMSAQVGSYPYPVDGLVVAMENYGYAKTLPGTIHNPNIMQGYAFKWADETEKTILREIEWSPSRTGLLNPVAIFDPVQLEGTTVTRASLHNLSIMRSMRLHVGDIITIYKANKIIPQLAENVNYDDESDYDDDYIHSLIAFCPTCGCEVDIRKSKDGVENVYCPNEDCPEKMIGNFVNFCSRDGLDIRGMSEETIKKLVDAGFVKEYSSFFSLRDCPDIAKLPGFGQISWENMCKAGQVARETDFIHFFTGLSIPNIGKGQLKILKNYISDNYKSLCESYNMNPDEFDLGNMLSVMGTSGFDFSVIDGFGSVLASDLSNWIKTKFNLNCWSQELNAYKNVHLTDALSVNSVNSPVNSVIAGKSFCITGKLEHFANRQALVDKIESLGGKWVDSVSSKTDYLINNDVTSSSGKNKKAKELNIPIISENDFLSMIS